MIIRFFLILVSFGFFSLPVIAGEGFIVNITDTTPLLEQRKKMIESVLESDTMHFGYSALAILIDKNQVEPRGMMKGKNITLSANIAKESEFIKLMVHELAHYIDIYNLVGTRFVSDPSEKFYTISWIDKTTKRANEGLGSFVSGYAATNKYEDFAESFTFYVFHNREFAERAMRNESLRQKYVFFSKYVFPDGEYIDTDFRAAKIPSYLWDTTKLPISVQKYLYSLK